MALHISMEVIIFLVALALLFDFMHGFHDSANSIATTVSTGRMDPHNAGVGAAEAAVGGRRQRRGQWAGRTRGHRADGCGKDRDGARAADAGSPGGHRG
mgnify:CR=1 FL=1